MTKSERSPKPEIRRPESYANGCCVRSPVFGFSFMRLTVLSVKIVHLGDDVAHSPERGCPQPQHVRSDNITQSFESPPPFNPLRLAQPRSGLVPAPPRSVHAPARKPGKTGIAGFRRVSQARRRIRVAVAGRAGRPGTWRKPWPGFCRMRMRIDLSFLLRACLGIALGVHPSGCQATGTR
jgi:hypothetical protein